MNVFYDLNSLPDFNNAVITTGSFDGVHVGHQKIFDHINKLAASYDGESVVITFDPHPRQVIYPKDNTLRLLSSTSEKIKYFKQFGIDNVVILAFTIEFSQLHAREYIEKFLIENFNPKCLVVGFDHRHASQLPDLLAVAPEQPAANELHCCFEFQADRCFTFDASEQLERTLEVAVGHEHAAFLERGLDDAGLGGLVGHEP